MILRPVISEKAMAVTEQTNTYAFYVPKSANKLTIKAAVADRYGVKVTQVRTEIIKGKRKKMIVKRGRQVINGQRSDVKKAYVTLADGEQITLFEGSE